jgi:RNA polymerase sigma-70 factor (ECF subfamily)
LASHLIYCFYRERANQFDRFLARLQLGWYVQQRLAIGRSFTFYLPAGATMTSDDFQNFIRRIRGGDARAAEELVRQFETTIRVAVRARLTSQQLRRQLDSVDICQSVLASFFVRAAAGQYELESPQQLAALLASMARNKLYSYTRKQMSQGRDIRRLEATGLEEINPSDPRASPCQAVASRELFEQVRGRLSQEERQLAELRGLGYSWPEIAAQLGGTADAQRMQLSRALDRIAVELKLDEQDEDVVEE